MLTGLTELKGRLFGFPRISPRDITFPWYQQLKNLRIVKAHGCVKAIAEFCMYAYKWRPILSFMYFESCYAIIRQASTVLPSFVLENALKRLTKEM